MHDAVQLEALGIPAVLIISEPFWRIAEAFAPTVGAPGYASIVSVPHPVASKSPDELHTLALSIVDQIVLLLTQ